MGPGDERDRLMRRLGGEAAPPPPDRLLTPALLGWIREIGVAPNSAVEFVPVEVAGDEVVGGAPEFYTTEPGERGYVIGTPALGLAIFEALPNRWVAESGGAGELIGTCAIIKGCCNSPLEGVEVDLLRQFSVLAEGQVRVFARACDGETPAAGALVRWRETGGGVWSAATAADADGRVILTGLPTDGTGFDIEVDDTAGATGGYLLVGDLTMTRSGELIARIGDPPCPAEAFDWTEHDSLLDSAEVECSGVTDAEGRFCCNLAGGATVVRVTGASDPDYDHRRIFSTPVLFAGSTATYCLPPVDGLVCGPCGAMPDVLTLSDPQGDVALTATTAGDCSQGRTWQGIALRSVSAPCVIDECSYRATVNGGAPGQVLLCYSLHGAACQETGSWIWWLRISWWCCDAILTREHFMSPAIIPAQGPCLGHASVGAFLNTVNCDPLSLEFEFDFSSPYYLPRYCCDIIHLFGTSFVIGVAE